MKKLSEAIFEALEQDPELRTMLDQFYAELENKAENSPNLQKTDRGCRVNRFLKSKPSNRQKNASSNVLGAGMRG